MNLFGEELENKQKKIKKDSMASKRIKKSIVRDTNCFEALNQLPENNEVASFVSMGLSDAGSFLFAVEKIKGSIDEAIIATWTISKTNVQKLISYLDEGKIKKLTFLLNDGLLKTNSTKPIYAFLCTEFDKRKDKIRYAVANTHAKIQMYRINDYHITISGSGNWSENPRIENYIMIGGVETFDFNKKWINECINE